MPTEAERNALRAAIDIMTAWNAAEPSKPDDKRFAIERAVARVGTEPVSDGAVQVISGLIGLCGQLLILLERRPGTKDAAGILQAIALEIEK